MTQDPEGERRPLPSGEVNPSHEADMVRIFESMGTDAELDADNICGVLKSNGIESVIKSSTPYPNLGVMVLVARSDVDRANALIAEALAAGPEAAADAESQTEPSS